MFKVLYLPPNVTSLIQPMDQGVIETFKRLYRKELLRRLLLNGDEDEESVITLFKKINLKDSAYMAAEAWNSVSAVTLKKAWNKILSDIETEENDSPSQSEMVIEIQEIPGFEDVDTEDMAAWLQSDEDDPGYQILQDHEIIETFTQQNKDEEDEEREEDDDNDTPTSSEVAEGLKGPSHDVAMECLETAMRWYENQEECDKMQLLNLKRLRDLAAKKRITGLKQKSILDFFNKD